MIREGDTVRLQPCKSPVWDTAIALRALSAASAAPRDAAISRAVDWLLDKEVRRRGDWAKTVKAEPGGWFFEHHNDFYPDIDDTIMVLMALRQQFQNHNHPLNSTTASLLWAGLPTSPRADTAAWAGRETSPQSLAEPDPKDRNLPDLPATLDTLIVESKADDVQTARQHVLQLDRVAEACERGRQWVLALQNRDGGWGAFDKDNDHQFLCHVPFADHNAMIDPSTPDITGRVLEALCHWGKTLDSPAIERAVAYLRRTQECDGSWPGRWGVNYIYGTWQVLVGLAAIGVPTTDPMIVRGANWLLSHQQACGGWGESADSYEDPSLRGQGPVTASQTAWALLGLIAAGKASHPAAEKAVRYLIQQQRGDGSWEETEFTGTGFPRVFYLRYHLYPIYFPLLALAQWASIKSEALSTDPVLNTGAERD
jgi:squalene-hopene/tetraprenyl-beta-curcumene cyclase